MKCKETGGTKRQTLLGNDLFVAKSDGIRSCVVDIVAVWKALDSLDLPRVRFHDLQHTAATNVHQLTGDFLNRVRSLGTYACGHWRVAGYL